MPRPGGGPRGDSKLIRCRPVGGALGLMMAAKPKHRIHAIGLGALAFPTERMVRSFGSASAGPGDFTHWRRQAACVTECVGSQGVCRFPRGVPGGLRGVHGAWGTRRAPAGHPRASMGQPRAVPGAYPRCPRVVQGASPTVGAAFPSCPKHVACASLGGWWARLSDGLMQHAPRIFDVIMFGISSSLPVPTSTIIGGCPPRPPRRGQGTAPPWLGTKPGGGRSQIRSRRHIPRCLRDTLRCPPGSHGDSPGGRGGKLHVEVFDADFPGETEEGARQLVEKVRTAVNKRFQDGRAQPRILWTDRGKGFYVPSTGRITPSYKEALSRCRFKAMFGDDASAQPGKLQEVMLHETSVSWLRLRLARSVPARPWLETRTEYEARLKSCCDNINEHLNVEGLCRALISRIDALVNAEGGRLSQ